VTILVDSDILIEVSRGRDSAIVSTWTELSRAEGATPYISLLTVFAALLYRYKSVGGFEYLADFLIGPRSRRDPKRIAKRGSSKPELLTRPGDSGTLWAFDPVDPEKKTKIKGNDAPSEYRPFGVQWGAQVFAEGGATSYALATSLSTICTLVSFSCSTEVRGSRLTTTL
jgi:hypothetical protein